MSIAALRDENEHLKALLTQTQAALSEHQGRWRRRKKPDAAWRSFLANCDATGSARNPRSCDQISIICRSKTWRSRKAYWMPRRREPRRRSRADHGTRQIMVLIAIAAACLSICRGWNGSSSLQARFARAVAAP